MRTNALTALAESSKIMVAAGAPLIGANVSFDVSSGNVERAVMRKAFADAGYPAIAKSCIPEVTVEQGLKMAPAQLKPPKGLALLPITEKDSSSRVEVGIWRGDPKSDARGSAPPAMGARVVINQGGRAEALPPVDGPVIESCMGYAKSLAVRANRLSRFVETNDVTAALANVISTFHGAKLASHTRGGFILARFVEPWLALTTALRPFGVVGKMADLWGLPTHKEEAREIAEASFGEKIKDLRARLSDAAQGKGKRSDSLQRSLDECIALVNEAKMFEDILGATVAAITTEADAVRKLFVKLQGGCDIVYNPHDVEKPLPFGIDTIVPEPEHEVKRLSDGTVIIPSESPDAPAD
jgi:hypothetical protein